MRQLTDLEQQAVRWLAQERDWAEPVVLPCSNREFDLSVNTEWFPAACLRMWLASYPELEYIEKNDLQNEAIVWGLFERVLATARKVPLISRNLRSGVCGVWSNIASEMGRCSNMDAIETCLDADRIETFGYKTAAMELNWLDERFGFDKVQRTIAKNIRLT